MVRPLSRREETWRADEVAMDRGMWRADGANDRHQDCPPWLSDELGRHAAPGWNGVMLPT